MAPGTSGRRGGYVTSDVPAAPAEEEVETVVTDEGVEIPAEQAELNEADAAAIESMKDEDADERVDEEYKSVTYVGEQETIPSAYGTFVKGQAVKLPASVADALAASTDGLGNAVFEVE